MPASVTTLECFLTYSCGFKCKYIHHGHESHCDFGLLMISFGRLYIQLYDSWQVIGSDGLWETLHRQEVIRIVGEYLTGVHQHQPLKVGGYRVTLGQMQGLLEERKARASSAFEDQNAATHLMRHAVGNNEFGTVDHERLSKMLSLPEELARMYRDDITIIITQFNPHVIGAQRQEGQS